MASEVAFLRTAASQCEGVTALLARVDGQLNRGYPPAKAQLRRTSRRVPPTEEVVDAAEDAVLQLQRQISKVVAAIEKAGNHSGDATAKTYFEQSALGKETCGSDLQRKRGNTEEVSSQLNRHDLVTSCEDLAVSPPSPVAPTFSMLQDTPAKPEPRLRSAVPDPRPPTTMTGTIPDSPLANLEDFGLSTLSLGILETMVKASSGDSSETFRQIETIPQMNSSHTHESNSPAIPTFNLHHRKQPALSPRKPRKSDPNSMFNALMNPAEKTEYEALSEYLKAQMTFEFLNDIIGEINEMLTDKRFMGDEEGGDVITINELIQATHIDPGKGKAVLIALLHMQKVQATSLGNIEDDKAYRVL
ncbi:hypothetical protein DFS34DRAFT_653011 [Phlyctochytrium arcticum]|nr:hypothetical protein DFS34DRAFT_653011 [Phlyctochytrium arcticum]